MMKARALTFFALVTFFGLCVLTLARAEEPSKPSVDRIFTPEREASIRTLNGLSVEKAFDGLKDSAFLLDTDLMNKAAFTVFKGRPNKALNYAAVYLGRTAATGIDGTTVAQLEDLYIAKKVFHAFPDQSIGVLSSLYDSGDAVTKGNVIKVAGNLAAGTAAKNLLVDALDDKTFSELNQPEMIGDPLRVCDLAYNQLVLRYKIKNVVRTIGMVHPIEVRDQYIEILRTHL